MQKQKNGHSCATNHIKKVSFTFWRPFSLCQFAGEGMSSGRFEFSTPKLCKNKWITNSTQKGRACLDFSKSSPDCTDVCQMLGQRSYKI